MTLLQIIFLAFVQGVTEFLPISSSAHLILVPVLTGWQDQGLAFDLATHAGTLAAVLIYFRREWPAMLVEGLAAIPRRRLNRDGRLGWCVVLATIPVGIVGLVFKDFIEVSLRSPLVISATTIIFGVALGWSYVAGSRRRDEYTVTFRDALVIGCAQALALIPGVSRSGITITAGLMVGLTGPGAARFSFLLSIPATALPCLLLLSELLQSAEPVPWNVFVIGAAFSCLFAFLCIHFFLKLLNSMGMMPFVAYRLALGVGLLIWYFA